MKKVIKLTESDLLRIVHRVITEQENTETPTNDIQQISSEVGSDIDQNVANEVMSCSFDEIGTGLKLKPEAQELLNNLKVKIKELISNNNKGALKSAFRQLKSRLSRTKDTEMNEQAALAGTFVLLGVSAPLWAWVAVGGIALILIIKGIVALSSWIPKKKGHGCSRTITYRVR